MENPDFLKRKYDLHNAPEVRAAAKRTEKRSGEKVPQNPADRIQNYLNRFKEIIERKEPAKQERGIEALKHILHDKFIIKPEEIPESYFDTQRRIAREQGHGDIEVTDEMREQLTEVAITDQKSSLDQWIDYLSSKDATYPDWLKYYAFRSILSMGEYDKEKKQFTKRSKGTVKSFPDLNREALAYVLDAIEKKQVGIKTVPPINIETSEDEYEKFEKILQGENFSKLYAFAIDKVMPTAESELADARGEWVKYRQGRDHMPLVESLQGHGTGWCTAGESTAKAQLEAGDFYVFYSLDKDGKPNVPRAAIRMQGDEIGEVRGIAPDQNLDPHIGDVVKAKLMEFPDGQAYEKKNSDMKRLTEIDNKTRKRESLNKEDLIFLYEIDQTIEGFGYQRDPRIEEIRSQRSPKEDAPIVMECLPEQIAWKPEDINEKTRAYIGRLEPGIFKQTKKYNIEHIYTSFPEGKIQKFKMELGGETKEGITRELEKRENAEGDGKIYVYSNVKSMLQSKEFFTLKDKENAKLVKLKVADLGFAYGATTDEIYKRAEEFDLELCPPETGPRIRLDYEKIFKKDQPKGEYFYIAMKQISDSAGGPGVWGVYRSGGGKRELDAYYAEPVRRWDVDGRFVFRFRKLDT